MRYSRAWIRVHVKSSSSFPSSFIAIFAVQNGVRFSANLMLIRQQRRMYSENAKQEISRVSDGREGNERTLQYLITDEISGKMAQERSSMQLYRMQLQHTSMFSGCKCCIELDEKGQPRYLKEYTI